VDTCQLSKGKVFVNSSAGALCQVTPSKLGNMREPGVTHNMVEPGVTHNIKAPSSSSQFSFLERMSIKESLVGERKE